MSKANAIVEVTLSGDGSRLPVGLMNVEQALALPPEMEIEASHPEHEAGATYTFISRDELKHYLRVTDD